MLQMSTTSARPLPERRVAGVRVHPLPSSDVFAAIERMLLDGRAHQVATVNPEFIVRACVEPEFARALEACDLATVDGAGLALALRWLHGVAATRVTGVDLIIELARRARDLNLPVFLLGAGPGVAGAAATALGGLAPGLRVAGAVSGTPLPSADEETAQRIRDGGARLLFVAFGAPAQERWIARNLSRLGPCVAVGVGGAFDYLAGVTPRAPLWVRRAGLEWLYRLVRQPWRWRRQLALPVFVYLALKERRSGG
jgi:N-acetylglucosaminyldiphosphoundecaprenol N-acetyl-beta-D-mannosaminyltransferase